MISNWITRTITLPPFLESGDIVWLLSQTASGTGWERFTFVEVDEEGNTCCTTEFDYTVRFPPSKTVYREDISLPFAQMIIDIEI